MRIGHEVLGRCRTGFARGPPRPCPAAMAQRGRTDLRAVPVKPPASDPRAPVRRRHRGLVAWPRREYLRSTIVTGATLNVRYAPVAGAKAKCWTPNAYKKNSHRGLGKASICRKRPGGR